MCLTQKYAEGLFLQILLCLDIPQRYGVTRLGLAWLPEAEVGEMAGDKNQDSWFFCLETATNWFLILASHLNLCWLKSSFYETRLNMKQLQFLAVYVDEE